MDIVNRLSIANIICERIQTARKIKKNEIIKFLKSILSRNLIKKIREKRYKEKASDPVKILNEIFKEITIRIRNINKELRLFNLNFFLSSKIKKTDEICAKNN